MRRTLLAVLTLFALAVWLLPTEGGAANPLKAAQRLLAKLKLVDGAGSGLDADRLQGLTPSDIVVQNIATSIGLISLAGYRQDSSVQVGAGQCQCVTTSCADANDFRVTCGGAFEPFLQPAGALTAMGPVPNQPTTCGVCGCNVSTQSATLAGNIICLTVPG